MNEKLKWSIFFIIFHLSLYSNMPNIIYLISNLKTKPKLDEDYALLGYYAARSGNPLPTFRDNLSIPYSRVKNPNFSVLI